MNEGFLPKLTEPVSKGRREGVIDTLCFKPISKVAFTRKMIEELTIQCLYFMSKNSTEIEVTLYS